MTCLNTTPLKAQPVIAANPMDSRTYAETLNDRGSQNGAIADILPDLATLSLADSDMGDQGAPVLPPSPCGRVRQMDRFVTIPQSIVHITVHANNSPVNIYTGPTPAEGGGAHLTARRLRGTTPNIPTPRRILCPTSGVQTPPIAMSGHATVSPVAQPLLFGTGVPTTLSSCLQSVPDTPASDVATLPAVAQLPAAEVADDNQDEYIAPPNPAHTGRWYTVVTGRYIRVWPDWLQMSKYVTCVPGNHHKSFPTRTEALTWYYTTKEDEGVMVIAN